MMRILMNESDIKKTKLKSLKKKKLLPKAKGTTLSLKKKNTGFLLSQVGVLFLKKTQGEALEEYKHMFNRRPLMRRK